MTWKPAVTVGLCAGMAVAAGCGTSARVREGSLDFSGRMLVAVSPEQAERAARPQSVAARAADNEGGWRFQRMPSLVPPGTTRAPGEGREWLIASMADDRSAAEPVTANPWDVAHDVIDGRAPGGYRNLLESLKRSTGQEITPRAVEPEVVAIRDEGPFSAEARRQSLAFESQTEGNELTVCDSASPHWPAGKGFAWHLGDTYSQLKSAREYVRQKRGAIRLADAVKVAVLDTGYDDAHAANPRGLDRRASRDFTGDPLKPAVGAEDPNHTGLFCNPGHGCMVISILAGGRVTVPAFKFSDDLGGAPDAHVVVYRISDSVVHFRPTAMAMAIKYAVVQGCDVINLSHGGLPSGVLADAVNEAYENGTAIFAASGDFFQLPLLRWTTPQSIVYPAAFERVTAVSAVTAGGQSYGKKPSSWSLLRFRRWGEWMMRGSFGPARDMTGAVSGYSPNIPCARYASEAPSNLLDLNGAGTSAATPQVSAAAALWLELHRTDPALAGPKWRSWEKTEAVYQALYQSSEKQTAEGDDRPLYFGNGLLKARRALDVGVPEQMQKRRPADVGFDWLRLWAELLPGVRSQSRDASLPKVNAHWDMVRTEVAQLVCNSGTLQDLMRQLDLDARDKGAIPEEKTRAFLKAVSRNKACSKFLRQAIRAAETASATRGPRK